MSYKPEDKLRSAPKDEIQKSTDDSRNNVIKKEDTIDFRNDFVREEDTADIRNDFTKKEDTADFWDDFIENEETGEYRLRIDEEEDLKIEVSGTDKKAPEAGRKTKTKSILYDLLFYAVMIFLCIYVIPNFVLQRTIVDGSSMEQTLHDGDHLYVEKLSYRFNALDRFDIIVFYPYGRGNEEYYVKRVIGLPGETVQIVDSNIYINGELLEEHYGKDPITYAGRAATLITLGDDEYFVLGDNRGISKDSRSEEVGNVKKANIGGRAFFRIKPWDQLGTIE